MAEQPAPRKKKTPEPWHPAPYDNPAIAANVKEWANDEKYKVALKWILFDLCRLGDLSFRVGDGLDSQRVTDFAEGKRFVALQIAKMIKVRPPGPREQP